MIETETWHFSRRLLVRRWLLKRWYSVFPKPEPYRNWTLEQAISQLLIYRNIFREQGLYGLADDVRSKLLKLGVKVQDTANQTKWRLEM